MARRKARGRSGWVRRAQGTASIPLFPLAPAGRGVRVRRGRADPDPAEVPRAAEGELPASEAIANASADFGRTVDQHFIDLVIDRWRGATLSNRLRMVEEGHQQAAAAGAPASAPRPLDPDRYRILKKV